MFRAGQELTITQIGVGMAHLAYGSFDAAALPRLQAAAGLAGFTELATFSGPRDTQAVAARRHDGLGVVGFRGTQPLSLEDIAVELVAQTMPSRRSSSPPTAP